MRSSIFNSLLRATFCYNLLDPASRAVNGTISMCLPQLSLLTFLCFFLHHLAFALAVDIPTPCSNVDNIPINSDYNLAGTNSMTPAHASTSSSTPTLPKLVLAGFGHGNTIATVVIIVITILNIIVYKLRHLCEANYGKGNVTASCSEQFYRRFSLLEILSATHNFDDELVIGNGGFGKVYKGVIDDGENTVAVKRLNYKSVQGAHEFWTEIETLAKLRHIHLAPLIGYCDEGHEMILVYVYMPRGTLADHLYKAGKDGLNSAIPWSQRLKICIGAARGLDYLHMGTEKGVIHRDVKTSNILLDKNWVAKISDFGLSKIGPVNQSYTHISTNVKGTFGYLDPDYFRSGRLTRKSDVYAFGVVLFEVLSGRPAVDMRLGEEACSLALWAQHCIQEGKIDLIVDPNLRYQISPHSLKLFAQIADKCLRNQLTERPTMANVVASLELALEQQESAISCTTTSEETSDESDAWDEQTDLITESTSAPLIPTSEHYAVTTPKERTEFKSFPSTAITFIRGLDLHKIMKYRDGRERRKALSRLTASMVKGRI